MKNFIKNFSKFQRLNEQEESEYFDQPKRRADSFGRGREMQNLIGLSIIATDVQKGAIMHGSNFKDDRAVIEFLDSLNDESTFKVAMIYPGDSPYCELNIGQSGDINGNGCDIQRLGREGGSEMTKDELIDAIQYSLDI